MVEYIEKQNRIQTLLAKYDLDALLLRRVSSFAWATCGAASYVNIAVTYGEAALLITPKSRTLITNNNESARLEQEEKLTDQGWNIIAPHWYGMEDPLSHLTSGLRLGTDFPKPGSTDLSADIARLRANLTPPEVRRFRKLGKLCAQAMESAIRAVRPGQSEQRIAARLALETEKRGVQAIVNLVAVDARIFTFRHPLPTARKLEKYAMLVLCGRKGGLVCSVTRFVHFGHLPDDLRRKAEAVAKVDAAFIAATHPGQTLGDIFQSATEAYAAAGYPDEWKLHHQGGPAGYEPREYLATPSSTDLVSIGQVFAWNPSITGTKSEDSILITKQGHEVLTAMKDWPMVQVRIKDETFQRPAILERT